MDECTQFTWVFLLKYKSDVNFVIPSFLNMVATQVNCTITRFRSDNAKELALADSLNEKGVIHQFSCVDSVNKVIW